MIKKANAIPIYEKDSCINEINYRIANIFSNLSKVILKWLRNWQDISILLGLNSNAFFQKDSVFNIVVIENEGEKTDKGGIFVALLIDLLKTFDFLLRNLFKIMLHV